jgi:hypothetical protein
MMMIQFFVKLAKYQRIRNKYGSVTENNDPTKNLSTRGGASNQVQRVIVQNFFLKSDINFIRQFFYQTEFKPICKRQSETI